MRFPVLTVFQPFASAIVAGVKRSEYRTWAPPKSIVGGALLIHAAANRRLIDDPSAMTLFRGLWPDMPKDLPLGAIIGVVTLDSVGLELPTGEIRWEYPSCGNVRWALSEPEPVGSIKCRGRRGIFYVHVLPPEE